MYANDFEFDGRRLSDYGFIICNMDNDTDMEPVSSGGTVTIQTARRDIGRKFFAVSAVYESCIEAEFTIAKDPCIYSDAAIRDSETRDIMRWLNKRSYRKMRFIREPIDESGDICYYNAAFNADKIRIGGATVGFVLHMTTDSPFGYGDRVVEKGYIPDGSDETILALEDKSDDIGYTYPDVDLVVMNSEIQEVTVENDMFADEPFKINIANETSTGDVFASQYTVDGKTLTLTGNRVFCDLEAFDENGDEMTGVTNLYVVNDIFAKAVVRNWTGGLEEGVYRLVITQADSGYKKVAVMKKKNDGSFETTHSDIPYSFNSMVPVPFGTIGGVIWIFSSTIPETGSYIEMKITKEQFVVGDDFNYNFIKIGNTQDKRTNVIRCDCPCILELSYEPVIKLSP